MNQETYFGIQGIDITTSAFLTHPEELFYLTNTLNQGKPREDWIGIEIYPVINRKPLLALTKLSQAFGIHLPIPKGINRKGVQAWQKEFPSTKVNRVHLPFCYDRSELWYQFLRSNFPKGFRNKLLSHAIWYAVGPALNMQGIELAESLADQEVGVNVHPNVLTGFIKDNRLAELKKRVAFVLAENSVNLNTSLIPRNQNAILYEPSLVIQHFVEQHRLDGFLLGVDHLKDQGIDPLSEIQKPIVQRWIRAIHFAKEDHEAIKSGEDDLANFLSQLKTTPHSFPLRLALDFHPFSVPQVSLSEKIEYFKKIINQIQTA